ncbi:MAG TPA: aspartate/glutamate racemase family protein [Clostridia bacterium]|nr:aspartate/glutamate racemase family protein [Clostridia bacterium]
MKTIGLIGGMSYESTVTYYNIINSRINNALGAHHSAKILLYSVDFEELYSKMKKNEWQEISSILINAAKSLEIAGADFILICTNTMHMVFDKVQEVLDVPLIHIADALIDRLSGDNIKKVLLLGTKTTMLQPFYTDKLFKSDIEVILPSDNMMNELDNIIFNELCVGNINDISKEKFISIIEAGMKKGVKACVFGCTELGLLVSESEIDIPVYDTAIIHSIAAADYAIL